MNFGHIYVMLKQKFHYLVLAPTYFQVMMLCATSLLCGLILRYFILLEFDDRLTSLDQQYTRISDQLDSYQQRREEINNTLMRLSGLRQYLSEIDTIMAQTRALEIESWLLEISKKNKLIPKQIYVSQNQFDKFGEFFRMSFVLSGSVQGMENFLETSLTEKYFLIWEKLIFNQDKNSSALLDMEMSVKHYSKLNEDDFDD